MDDYLFNWHVKRTKVYDEKTLYLTIYNYSDTSLNSLDEHPLETTEFENFLNEKGAFEPRKLPAGVKLLNGIRLILQKDVQHPETFTPNVISLSHAHYEAMVRAMRLPFRAIEGTAIVGPFFWSSHDPDKTKPYLQIIFRKSDVRKKGRTRGWELMLSHNLATGVTSGFAKGTKSSDLEQAITHLKACARHVSHPLLLPVIILSHDLSAAMDQKQRDARDWLRRLEHAVSLREEIHETDVYVREDDKVFELDTISRDLVECHSQVLWKRPEAYQEIICEIEKAMARFLEKLPEERNDEAIGEQHRSMLARLEFYTVKLNGVKHYVATSLARLDIQRSALYNIIAQKDTKLNLEMAGQQRRLAHASKRDSTSMKTISLLGAIFLPSTYLASLFSTTFFDFLPNRDRGSPGGGGSGSESNNGIEVSPMLWLFFVITVPITLAIVFGWLYWDRRREQLYHKDDENLEEGILELENQIMMSMRRRTMSKQRTWNMGPKNG